MGPFTWGQNYHDLENRIRREIRIVKKMHEVLLVQPAAKKPSLGMSELGNITFRRQIMSK